MITSLKQTAVLVDAGYLYAQGASLLAGRKVARASVKLSVPDLLDQIAQGAAAASPECRLLRIYWYDGLLRASTPSTEQDSIAKAPNTKLRLGIVNSRGKQKGVDALIITDLIELARNGAISDGVIISGDEDIRIGVEIAQTFGVRIHLIGIEPAAASQSPELIRTADTRAEWGKSTVSKWMSFPAEDKAVAIDSKRHLSTAIMSSKFAAIAASEALSTTGQYSAAKLDEIIGYLDANQDAIPNEIDRYTLARMRDRLGRELTLHERRTYRKIYITKLREARRD